MGILSKFKQSRVRYWSCSAFANHLRGTPKPHTETSDGWTAWHKTARGHSKVRYWLAEEGLDILQDLIHLPLDVLYSIKYYVNNRWVTRTHALTASRADIPRGEWRDVGSRFLPCMFNELVDFVEVEQAWSNVAWSLEARERFKPPFWGYGWLRWRTWRCPEAGLDHLRWAAQLKYDDQWIKQDDPNWGKPTQQAITAQEILDLYHWWKHVRPQRPDPHDASGWTELYSRRREKIEESEPDVSFLQFLDGKESAEQKDEVRQTLDLCHKIEQQYEQEDEEMMIRLIKVRGGLWT